MTYDDLPYEYKQYADHQQGWEEEQALAYWQQAAEYRQYVTTRLTSQMSTWIGGASKKAGGRLGAYNAALYIIRGFRAKIT